MSSLLYFCGEKFLVGDSHEFCIVGLENKSDNVVYLLGAVKHGERHSFLYQIDLILLKLKTFVFSSCTSNAGKILLNIVEMSTRVRKTYAGRKPLIAAHSLDE